MAFQLPFSCLKFISLDVLARTYVCMLASAAEWRVVLFPLQNQSVDDGSSTVPVHPTLSGSNRIDSFMKLRLLPGTKTAQGPRHPVLLQKLVKPTKLLLPKTNNLKCHAWSVNIIHECVCFNVSCNRAWRKSLVEKALGRTPCFGQEETASKLTSDAHHTQGRYLVSEDRLRIARSVYLLIGIDTWQIS